MRLSEVLSRRINQNPSEAAAASSAEEILRQTQLTNPEEGLALAPSGWHPVRASFEVDKVNEELQVSVPLPRCFLVLTPIYLINEFQQSTTGLATHGLDSIVHAS